MYALLANQGNDLDVSFENLKLSHPGGAYKSGNGSVGHMTNYFACVLRNANQAENTVTYTKCTFPNGVCNNQYGKTVFDNCQFTNATGGLYNLWNYGGNTEVKNSTFTGVRGIKTYNEGTLAVAPTVKVENTTFTSLSEKAAIVASKATDITLTNVSATGCNEGLFQKDIENGSLKTTIAANGTGISGKFDITATTTADAAKDEFNISAGTFTSKVSNDYCADGFEVKANADGTTYGVVEAATAAAAQIGEKEYATLADAIAAAQDGQTVTLLTDVTENVEISKGKRVTLDLNGKTLNGGTGTAKAALTNYGTITIKDSSADKAGTIKRDDNGIPGETSYYVILNQGTMTIEGGNVRNNSGYRQTSSIGSMNGSSLICNGDCNEGGTLTIKGGTFTQYNFIAIKNGALGVLHVTGGTITSNHSAIQNWFNADITGGEITGQLWTDAYKTGESVGKTTIGGDATFTGEIVMDIYANVAPELAITGGNLKVTKWNITTAAAKAGAKPAISGGTFTSAVPENYCAEGFIPTKNADGTYGVKAGAYVAQIGEVKYATLADAIAAAEAGQTVTLLANTTEDVIINKNITLDLGGKTLTNTNADKATISVSNGATATVKNGSVMGGTSYYNIEVTKGSNANLTLEDVTATAGNTDSSMIDNWGTLTINSGTYTGGLNVVKSEEGSKLTITGGTFTLEYATNGYTGVVFAYGDTTISGGEFTQNLTTTGRWNHPQVVATGVVEGYEAITRVTGGHFVNKMSGEGIFRGVGKGTSDNFEVSGGTFNKSVSDSFFKEGYFAQKNTDGTYGVGGPAVAKVNSAEGYNTLDEAIAAAKAGDTVTLLQNVTVDKPISVDKAITLDLGGKTLTSTWAMPSDASGADRYALVNNAKVTLTNGTFAAGQARAIGAYAGLTLNSVTVSQTLTGGHACVAFCKAGATYTIKSSTITGDYAVANFANNATISITNSTKLNGTTCGLYHNGSNYGLKLTVTNTTINGSLDGTIGNENDPSGVYISGSASHGTMQKATFTNCTIKGATAIEVKYTDLTLNKCTVEATVKTPSYDKNNNGMTALGFAVVSTDNSKDGVTPVPAGTVTIKGKGNYTGLVGLGALKSVKETYKDFADGTIKVSGGTFNSAVMPEYCAEGFIPVKNEDGTYGVREANYVAQVLDKNGNPVGGKYETLQKAIDAAKSNETVTMLADTNENVTIDKGLTLDLNGFTLNGGTEKGKPALTITARTVTIKDSSKAQTGTIMREDTAENSGVSSHYVIDIQGNAWVMFEGGNVKNGSGNAEGKGASLVRVGDDSVAKYPGLNIKGGTFTQDNFIVIKVDSGDLFLNGGTLNSTDSYAIEDWHRATIKGGTVNGAVAAWTYSGGLNSSLEISGGTINGNVESVSYDGAAGKKASVSITGGVVNGMLSTHIYNKETEPSKDMATIEVTGGTFSSDPTKYLVECSAVTQNADGTYGVAKAYLARIGETFYYTMEDAFQAQTNDDTIVLLRDYTTGGTFNSGSINRTVDLNGHTWTCTGTDANSAAFEINYPNASLTVKNGKIVSSQLVGLIPSAMGGTIKYDNSSLTFENVEMSTTATSGIETNGNNTNDSVKLVKSTLNVPNGFGIYFPSSGKLTIDNSTITAKTMGVQVCAGSLSINSGSTITVSGDGIEKTGNDGAIQDGAAISIVNRTGYKGLNKIEVTGGTFKANGTNAAIKAYDWDNTNKVEKTFTANDKVFVSGGTFSSAVPEGLCAEGYISVVNDNGTHTVKKGVYVAKVDNVKYETLQKAIDAASHRNGGQTEVTLLCDLTITETVVFAKKYSAGSVLLNLGGYTLTGNGCRALQINKGSLYLENGTVTSTGIIDSSSVIRIGSNEETYNGATPMLYMQKDAKVVAPESYGVTIFGSATRGEKLKVMSNAEIIATGPSPAISGNGGANYNTDDRTSDWKAEEIIIGENAVISAANNYAIYHPECGTLNIQGGTITGTGGIQMCSGTLKISNSPKITANGSANYDYTGDAGVVYDAAAISVINRGYPQGPATVTIKGTPTVTAANGEVIHAFTWSNSNKTDGEWAEAGDYINISGGTFSSIPDNMAALCKVGYRAVEDKDNNVYIVKEGKYVIEVTSRIQDTNQTVATPTGGGQADYGEEVTVTTYAVTGFTFLGWYDSEGKQLSAQDDMTYTHKVTGDCTLIAKYAQDSTRMFRLTVNGTVFTVNERTEYAHHYSELASGSRVAIVYTGTDNFLYWVNASKNVVTTSETLEYTMVNDAEFTAVTAPATSDSAIVVFKNNIERGQELQARRYYSNETIVFPATPSSYGKTFAYWAILDTNGNILKDQAGNAVVATESAIKAKIAKGTGYIVVAAVYTANGYYKATAHFVDSNGNTVANDMVNANVPTGSGWQVTAPDVDKKFFSHWKDADGNVLSTNQTYAIYAMDTVEVTAVYVDTENDKRATMNTVKLTALTRVVGNSHDLGLVAQYDVASGKAINRVGILFTTNANYKDSLTLENKKVSTSAPLDKPENNSNVYRYWLNGINNLSTVVYARAYVTTTDGETIYSEVIKGSFNSWNGN